MSKVCISIVTYNSKDVFITLDHLRPLVLKDPSLKVVIYDNGSERDYLDKVASYEFVQIIEGTENRGFGYGHNQVLLNSDADFGLICNPDIIVNSGVIDYLEEKLRSESTLAAAVPKVLNEDGTTQYLVRRKLAVFDYFLRFIPFKIVKKLFSKRLAAFECRDLSDDHETIIKMGSGCFMLVDLAKYREIGGFDERFFMYFEDNDICLRFGEAGYQICYTPFQTVTHLYGKGAHRSRKLFKIFMESMFKFFNKWGWKFF